MKTRKFNNLNVKILKIAWNDYDSAELPEKEDYSIGFPTLLENWVVEPDLESTSYILDENALKCLLRDMLEEDYGTRPNSVEFTFTRSSR